ncbi:GNAT family N-acetyltransferase [Brevibacillus centrosporus]|uniref:GNAT family N-acetyltransferase n=1 Tax=Brevibacillus centrosporus TaxID=54910 RepID=UPI002E1CB899|nr:GNAT family N-acetyltransferase [Brevibacillus centrosporus]MED1953234.1 GNAT family N-acetyltransferase [Brevibacillus centrosporus]
MGSLLLSRLEFGAAAIKELCRHLKENQPDCQRIRLTVHPANEAGVKFYTTLGFTDDHVLTYGEPTSRVKTPRQPPTRLPLLAGSLVFLQLIEPAFSSIAPSA